MNPLRRDILVAIGAYQHEHGLAPTVRELCDITGHRSTSVITYHLQGLRTAGLIKYQNNKARTLQLTDAGWAEVARLTAATITMTPVPEFYHADHG